MCFRASKTLDERGKSDWRMEQRRLNWCLGQRMESKTQRSIESRYAVSQLAIFSLFAIANSWDYVKYSKLIAAYDYIVPFGVPFVMVIEGGATVVQPEIVWNGVAANAFLLLCTAGVAAWLWHKIASR